jgi:signal transduction histidine kinase
MKSFIISLCCLVALSGIAFYYISAPSRVQTLEARQGIINLESHMDFSKTLYHLDGEWEFYYNQLYTPGDFVNGSISDPSYIKVPSSWSENGYPLKGYATYHLKIHSSHTIINEFMLLVPEMPNASKMWINGRMVFSAGEVSESTHNYIPSVRNAFVDFRPQQNGEIDIVIQVSNYDWAEAGITYAITMGTPHVLLMDSLSRRIYLAFFIGTLVMMFTYHFILFLHRREDKIYLVFALYCLSCIARSLLESNGLVQLFLPLGLTTTLIRLYFLSIISVSFLATLFIRYFFEVQMPKKYMVLLYSICFALPGLLSIFVPFATFGNNFIFLSLVGIIPFLIIVFVKKLIRNQYDCLYIIVYIFALIWGPLTKVIWKDALFMPGVASNFFLILVQCFILSHKYVYYQAETYRLKESNRILEELSHMKTHFLQNISHEVKTPLTVISSDIQFVHSSLLMEEDHEELCLALQNAQDEVMRTARLMEGTLDFAVKDENLEHMELLHIQTFLHNIEKTFQSLCSAHGNKLKIIVPDSLPNIYANQDMLKQILSNLINNSCRHTHSDTISIQVTQDESELYFRVTDHGSGIPEEILPQIWNRHVSGDGRSGLGLPICKTLVTLHHGRIKIDSQPKKGTCVTFTLPLPKTDQEENHLYDANKE